jgi:hypothetical protein
VIQKLDSINVIQDKNLKKISAVNIIVVVNLNMTLNNNIPEEILD